MNLSNIIDSLLIGKIQFNLKAYHKLNQLSKSE